jgi:uncharacterized protein
MREKAKGALRLIYPFSYIQFLCHFHGDRDYFECHEVLEEHWKKSGMERSSIWVGLIQVAASLYHYRRGNMRGAVKLLTRALESLSKKRSELHALGINYSQLMEILQKSLKHMKKSRLYTAIDLPIQDAELLVICKERVRRHGSSWGRLDDVWDEGIVHKHLAKTHEKKTVIQPKQ